MRTPEGIAAESKRSFTSRNAAATVDDIYLLAIRLAVQEAVEDIRQLNRAANPNAHQASLDSAIQNHFKKAGY